LLLVAAAATACGSRELSVTFFRSEAYTFSAAEQRRIQAIASTTLREVRRLLPVLPKRIQLTVRPGTDVIEETGESGTAMTPDAVMWTVDPQRHGGVEAITSQWLRASLSHELHHLARSAHQPLETLMDRAVYEGMATVFEREFSGIKPPWGAYPLTAGEWVTELSHLPPDSPVDVWIYKHPDGRRWIGMKAGTYLVDQAMKRSGRSISDLTKAPTREILKLAGSEPSS
jgi:uncharacterized protein YjaZ